MFGNRKSKPEAKSKAPDPYARHRRYQRKKSAEVSDIGALPAVVNTARRHGCKFVLEKFLVTYFPRTTGSLPFSEDHRSVIDRLQRCGLEGGNFIDAVYRGFGKTTIGENAAIWTLLNGHRKFLPLFGADAEAASANIDSIKMELAENDLLYEDFPEVCHAIRALEGKPQRCASQTHEGRQTHIEWRGDTIVLPTVYVPPGWGTVDGPRDGELQPCEAGGGIITTRGLMSGSRGMKHKRPDGTQQRPDFVIIDDPQTDESASTPLQVNKRMNVIRKSILRLGGHDKKIAVIINATVIKPDDLIERMFDPRKFPAWQSVRFKMVRSWAGGYPASGGKPKDWKGSDSHERLWLGDYQRIRNNYDPDTLGDQQQAQTAATEFYRNNRELMDTGAVVSWEHCYNHDTELSAIQHAYNILIDDGEDVFASECQNEPIREVDEGQQTTLTADEIAAKVNGLDRHAVPLEASHIVAHIDVQKTLLYFSVGAFADGFGGDIIDYNTWPDQHRKYFSLRDARKTYQKATGENTLEKALYAALEILVNDLAGRELKRQDGAVMKIERILIDANWGDSTDVVYQFCRQSAHSAILTPAHGRYVGATSRPFNEWKPRDGDRVGLNWRQPAVENRRTVRHVNFDTNFWKGFMHKRWATARGGTGCLSVYGQTPDAHRMFADQIVAENGIEVEAKGRKVIEYHLKPDRPDNHLLDNVVGCCVAASMQGVSVIKQASMKIKRVKLSEIQKKKAQNA